MSDPADEHRLIAAVQSLRLAEHLAEHLAERRAAMPADGEPPESLARAADTAARIAGQLADERERLLAAFRGAGVDVRIDPVGELAQLHTLTAHVADADTALAAADVLDGLGFDRWERWTGGAGRAFLRTADHLNAGRTEPHGRTTVVRVRWRPTRPDRSRLDRALRPTAADFATVDLPPALWWAYPLVRLVRLAAERLRLRRRHPAGLGPHLATPASLLDPLVDAAGIDAHDHVADLGCGDGRWLTAAVARTGCRATGVELDGELARRARERVEQAGLGDRIDVVHGDALGVDLSDVDVVLLFLPVTTVADILPELLRRLRPGSRVILHEQQALPADVPAPESSRLLIGDDAFTVAHTWTARRPTLRV